MVENAKFKWDIFGDFQPMWSFLLGPFPCALGLYDVKYEGPLDNNELPKGNGRLTRMVQKVAQNQRKNCFELLPTIESMHGRFVKGYPQGKATIR